MRRPATCRVDSGRSVEKLRAFVPIREFQVRSRGYLLQARIRFGLFDSRSGDFQFFSLRENFIDADWGDIGCEWPVFSVRARSGKSVSPISLSSSNRLWLAARKAISAEILIRSASRRTLRRSCSAIAPALSCAAW